MNRTKITAALVCIASLLAAQAASAAPPAISNVTVDSVTSAIVITGTCTPNASGTNMVKVIFVDGANVSHLVKKVNCPASGTGTTKVKPPFVDQQSNAPLTSGSYQVCLKQLGTTSCWTAPISI